MPSVPVFSFSVLGFALSPFQYPDPSSVDPEDIDTFIENVAKDTAAEADKIAAEEAAKGAIEHAVKGPAVDTGEAVAGEAGEGPAGEAGKAAA